MGPFQVYDLGYARCSLVAYYSNCATMGMVNGHFLVLPRPASFPQVRDLAVRPAPRGASTRASG